MHSSYKNKLHKLTEIKFYKTLPNRLLGHISQAYHEKVFLKLASKESIFTKIWEKNLWDDKESVSGPGSTLAYTENLRKELPIIYEKFSIKSLFDAPCGDLTWMKEVLKHSQVEYIGGDIVKEIVEKNQQYSKQHISFIVFDVTTQEFPVADMWLCRDLLFHLSYSDILKALKQFAKSQIPFLLTTTHINKDQFSNEDILTGYFRLIDLFKPPFNFNITPLYRFDDYIYPNQPREMCLFSREQIIQILPALESAIKKL